MPITTDDERKEEKLKALKFMEFLMLQLVERKTSEKNPLSASSSSSQDEKWITINGARVKIEKGQTKDQAAKEFLKGKVGQHPNDTHEKKNGCRCPRKDKKDGMGHD